jgi:Na+-translocating ferredoxin:NAD+ oxidoreductase RNF subunit RnfB
MKETMAQLNNVLDILKLLDKSNCRECGEATCIAFAATVHKGEKELRACPNLEKDVIDLFGDGIQKCRNLDQDAAEAMTQLKNRIAVTDLAATAQRVGGKFFNNCLKLKILGKISPSIPRETCFLRFTSTPGSPSLF